MAGYIRQGSWSDGDTIAAANDNNEFDAIASAFSNTTGHSHDGTAAEGPVIGLIGDAGVATPLNKLQFNTGSNYLGLFIDVSSVSVEQLRFSDGLVAPVLDNDIDLGTALLSFKDAHIQGTATIGILSVTTIASGAKLTLPEINDTSSDHQYVVAVNELTSNRTVTLPLLVGNDEFTFNDHTQTLTNKTLTSPTINTGTLASPVINGAISGDAFLDEDTMSSDSATKVSSQQAIKAYVDSKSALAFDATTEKTAGFTAVSGTWYRIDTSGGAFTLTLPASPTEGNSVGIIDVNGTFNTNNLTLGRNGSNVFRTAADGTLDIDNWTTALVYVDSTNGWIAKGF